MNPPIILLALAMALCTGCQHASKDDSSSGVLKVVQATMDGLAAHDSVALSKRSCGCGHSALADGLGGSVEDRDVDRRGICCPSRTAWPGFLERTWRETAWVDGDVAW